MIEKGEILYTVNDVAKMLRVNIQTVRRYCRDGDIEAIKLGTHWRIPASALAKVMHEQPYSEEELDNGYQRIRIS